MRIEQVDVKSDKLFTAADINGFSVKNAIIETKDSKISLLGVRKLTFENVQFLVPGDSLNVVAASDEDVKFIKCKPKK
ncbi:hypothetical protein [Pedobacter hiemivivus]|uniref:Uncharacterized protein n=1 Tax=Pedobacter hiemivivus TaxID=2530454 RepID=A0A4V2MK29_9SPHI|nr:hypothetical protein [Pedobacter hiemivivus]TCC96546.1 hypothetical protein EZ444_11240 [Pedobacter hiemivivus]